MSQAQLKKDETVEHPKKVQTVAPSELAGHEKEQDHGHALSRADIYRVLFVAIAACVFWFLEGWRNPYVTVLGVICAIVGGFPIFHEAYENIVQRRMTMELSMTIAIVALVDWACRTRDAGELLPLPKEFRQHTLHPFR